MTESVRASEAIIAWLTREEQVNDYLVHAVAQHERAQLRLCFNQAARLGIPPNRANECDGTLCVRRGVRCVYVN